MQTPVTVTQKASIGCVEDVHRQWASRPDDQRFLSVDELRAHVAARRERSIERSIPLEHVSVRASPGGGMMLTAGEAKATLNHFSFGQLCTRAKAPAGYLRSLPAELAQLPLQWSLEQAERADGKLLVTLPEGMDVTRPAELRAITSPSYGRIWDLEVVDAVRRNCDLTRWKVPAASYATKDPKRASTLYGSDRDVFMFLVDDQHPIAVPGEPGNALYRGFYVWNSEVGDNTFGIATFLHETVCDNRRIWNVKDFTEIKIRHTAGAPDRFMREAAPFLTRYLEASTAGVRDLITSAQAKRVGETTKDVRDWLKTRGFTGPTITQAMEYAESIPGDPRSLWNLDAGLTAVARNLSHTDARVDLERKSGALMAMAA